MGLKLPLENVSVIRDCSWNDKAFILSFPYLLWQPYFSCCYTWQNWITRDWKAVCTAQNETLEEQDCNCIGTIPIPGIRRMKRKIHPREIQLNKQIKIKGIIHIWSKWLMSRLWRTTCFDGGLWQWRYITDAHSIRPSPYDNCHQ